MRLLACAEAERLGWSPTLADLDAVTRWWCERFGLTDPTRFARWLGEAGLDWSRFRDLMRQFAAVTYVLERYGELVDAHLCDHQAIHTVHRFTKETPR